MPGDYVNYGVLNRGNHVHLDTPSASMQGSVGAKANAQDEVLQVEVSSPIPDQLDSGKSPHAENPSFGPSEDGDQAANENGASMGIQSQPQDNHEEVMEKDIDEGHNQDDEERKKYDEDEDRKSQPPRAGEPRIIYRKPYLSNPEDVVRAQLALPWHEGKSSPP